MSARGKCPICVDEGERSNVYPPTGVVATLMGHYPFYDEDGIYHSHDPNSRTGEWSCSRGHRWVVSEHLKCPAAGCDYGGDQKVRVVDSAANGETP